MGLHLLHSSKDNLGLELRRPAYVYRSRTATTEVGSTTHKLEYGSLTPAGRIFHTLITNYSYVVQPHPNICGRRQQRDRRAHNAALATVMAAVRHCDSCRHSVGCTRRIAVRTLVGWCRGEGGERGGAPGGEGRGGEEGGLGLLCIRAALRAALSAP